MSDFRVSSCGARFVATDHMDDPGGKSPRSRSRLAASAPCVAVALVIGLCGIAEGTARQGSGWRLPPDAPSLKNPLTVDQNVLDAGRKVFLDKCRKCHGPKGLGDGPDADPDYAEEMNLTNPKRAERNPDGVVYYKVMNGRGKPKMPSFKDELSQEQIWAVVAYVQSLRRK